MEKLDFIANYRLMKDTDGDDWWLMRPDGSTLTTLTEQDALALAPAF